MDKNNFITTESCYGRLTSLGAFYPLKIGFDNVELKPQIEAQDKNWVQYNKEKPHIGRLGLSLFSLDGSTSGEIDLNSIFEYNNNNQTIYKESDFSTPTPYWSEMSSISTPLSDFVPHLGRSHIIKFDQGGFFPFHRDRGDSFRLISFFNCSSDQLVFILEDKKIHYDPCRLYFIDTRRPHCVFSFKQDSMILVLNVNLTFDAVKLLEKSLQDL